MAVRQALLAMLEASPKYGYQLKTEFETSTSHIWPLNIGQVYTTLARLGRDGMIEHADGPGDHQLYRITDAGRRTTDEWFSTPVDRATPQRDELTMKVMMAMRLGQDPARVIQAQRSAALRALQDYTRLKAEADPNSDLTWLIMLDSITLLAEAEVRWLDLVEARINAATESGSLSLQTAGSAPAQSESEAAAADQFAVGDSPLHERERMHR